MERHSNLDIRLCSGHGTICRYIDVGGIQRVWREVKRDKRIETSQESWWYIEFCVISRSDSMYPIYEHLLFIGGINIPNFYIRE